MSESTRKREPLQVGYLTTLEHQDFGILGGYLVVDAQGRPLEFHCTAPVQPSRAQEILYGHSLRPYLLGEQIGGGLVQAAKLKPQIVVVDQVDLGAFRSDDKTTLALLSIVSRREPNALASGELPRTIDTETPEASAYGSQHSTNRGLKQCPSESKEASAMEIGGHAVTFPFAVQDMSSATKILESLAQSIDLAEPFERIQLAIREAQRIGEDDQHVDDQSDDFSADSAYAA